MQILRGSYLERTETSTIIGELTTIWQSVLQREPIGVEDNFFALGGDPSLAVKLFDEVAAVCGREIPPLAVYHAPTILDLAAVMQQPSLPKFSPLVPLKAGEEEPPVFVTLATSGQTTMSTRR